MKVIVQRSLNSSVTVHNKIIGKIDKGLVLLVGFHINDDIEDINYMVKKILNLRIFNDEDNMKNKSILDVGGSILSISQFTLQADTKKGNRPSYINAMKGDSAYHLYNKFNEELKKYVHVETGLFGADMKLNILNDGPVTIILESRD